MVMFSPLQAILKEMQDSNDFANYSFDFSDFLSTFSSEPAGEEKSGGDEKANDVPTMKRPSVQRRPAGGRVRRPFR